MGFQCINIRQVPWEVLKTAAFGIGFQHLPRDLANVNAWKTMFDPYIIIIINYSFITIPLIHSLVILNDMYFGHMYLFWSKIKIKNNNNIFYNEVESACVFTIYINII